MSTIELIYIDIKDISFGFGWKTLISYICSWVTWSSLIHVQLNIGKDVYTITMQGKYVEKREKHDSNIYKYKKQIIPVNYNTYLQIHEEAEKMVREKVSFNYRGFFLYMLFPQSGELKNTCFCSEMCARILKKAQILPKDFKPERTTPGSLFKIMENILKPEQELFDEKNLYIV
ncbi:MAG: hypothetical protein EOP34_02015 [Rickettsiales bacterium]|nr:MAG: hypothetical protein EOP34_02015 [Rickettsiales bacterium]